MNEDVHLLGLALHVLPILHDQCQDRHLMDFEKEFFLGYQLYLNISVHLFVHCLL